MWRVATAAVRGRRPGARAGYRRASAVVTSFGRRAAGTRHERREARVGRVQPALVAAGPVATGDPAPRPAGTLACAGAGCAGRRCRAPTDHAARPPHRATRGWNVSLARA